MSTSRKPIVVVGSVTMDMVTCTPQIPRIGQTVIGTSFSTTPGGKGANQAVAAARLGYPVQFRPVRPALHPSFLLKTATTPSLLFPEPTERSIPPTSTATSI